MATISKLVLKNFKRFRTLELDFDPELNILSGGNEAGKSSVLQAIDIVLSASRSKVEALGLETLFNMDCIAEFMAGERKIEDLPELLVEVYRRAKVSFRDLAFKEMNEALGAYKFDIRKSPKACVETDIMITEEDMPIDSKGRGRQCFIKTEFALRNREHSLDVLLLEEPENHLSHVHMHSLIERIRGSLKKQIFIATHSSFIATRLNLQKVLVLSNENPPRSFSLKQLTTDTAKFFMKAPDNNLLELALCKKVILVEGDAEFILMDALYRNSANGASTEADCVHVLSVDGTSFKRYLELAKLIGCKVAAIRDNDSDYQTNCVTNYVDHITPSIKVFADNNNARHTFEVCMYEDNKVACDELFTAGRKLLTVQDYMLKNKTDAAFSLLEKKGAALVAPKYIQDAVAWIKA